MYTSVANAATRPPHFAALVCIDPASPALKSGNTNQTEPAPADTTEEESKEPNGKPFPVNVAETVTVLLGIVNWQGLAEDPPEHTLPLTIQPENCHVAEGVAVTDTGEPTSSWHEVGLGQLGETDPWPEATLVVNVAKLPLLSGKTISALLEEQEPKSRLLVSAV